MKSQNTSNAARFPLIVGAVADLKARLQHDYEDAYPALAEIIHLVLDEEEANAWDLSFPHLFLPDLVEAHIEKLNLRPAEAGHHGTAASHSFAAIGAPLLPPIARSRRPLSTIRRQAGPGEESRDPNVFETQLEPVAQH